MGGQVKRCSKCKTQKPESEFTFARKKSTGRPYLSSWCMACIYKSRDKDKDKDVARSRERETGQIDLHRMMLEHEQQGKCAICQKTPTSLNTDHCHTTLRVRGLLCHKCNLGLANFDDDPDILALAIKYLERTSNVTK